MFERLHLLGCTVVGTFIVRIMVAAVKLFIRQIHVLSINLSHSLLQLKLSIVTCICYIAIYKK